MKPVFASAISAGYDIQYIPMAISWSQISEFDLRIEDVSYNMYDVLKGI